MQPNSSNDNTFKLDAQHPYPGPRSFQEIDNEYFFGRQTQIDELFDKIQKNTLTVLFGKSGIGKTSLLQAGLIPKLKKNYYLPIYLQTRFDWENEKNPLERVKLLIEEKIKEVDKKAISIGDLTLWEYFHTVQIFGGLVKPLLIIDQFEEIFKGGKTFPGKINPMILEIGDLSQNWVPVVVQEKYKNESIPYPLIDVDYRVVISLREDYLPQLLNLNRWMPSVVNGRYHYRISQMKGEDAVQAVLKPGKEVIKEEAAVEIIRKIPASKDFDYLPYEAQEISWESKQIEPFLLSLVCYQANEKRLLANADEISPDFLIGINIKDIVKNYYEETIKNLENGINVRIFIEEELLTSEGERKLAAIDSIKNKYFIHENSINMLVDKRIIRKERRNEIEYIELIHDEFARILIEVRNKRREEEKKIAEKKKQEEQKELEVKKKKLRFFIGFSTVSIIVIAVLIWLSIIANRQFNNAQVSRLAAEALLEFSQDNTRAIRIAEMAYKKAQSSIPPHVYKALSDIGYSSIEKPFYITNLLHNGPIYSAVFSPDGTRILTASEDGTAKIWDIEGNVLTEVKHDARIMSAVFSPDGSRILTASWDRSVKIWNIGGVFMHELKHPAVVKFVVLSPDKSKILTASNDGVARLWNLQGALLVEFKKHSGIVSSAMFSRDATRILTASNDGTAKLWDIKGTCFKEFKHNGQIFSAVFSPKDDHVLTASQDGTAKLWDLQGTPLKEYKHNGGVYSAVFSPAGDNILTASQDGTAKLWDIDGIIRKEFKHDDAVFSATFSPNNSENKILTVSRDGTAKLWNLQGKLLAELNNQKDELTSAAFSPDGSLVITASKKGIAKVWKLDNGLLVNLDKHTTEVKTAVFSPDGKRILTASRDNTAKLWNREGQLLANLDKHKEMVYCTAFSPDGCRVLTASFDGTAKIWDMERLDSSPIELKHTKIISSAVFSHDGQWVLTASMDYSAKLWDLGGSLRKNFFNPGGAVTSAVFSLDDQLILTTSVDRTAKVWRREGKEAPLTLTHESGVTAGVFSPDNKWILTGTADGAANLWDLQGKKISELKHKDAVAAVGFSPDSQLILTASADGTAKAWNLKGELVIELKHSGEVSSAVFSPNGKAILTASYDKTAKLWNLKGDLLADLDKHNDVVNSAVFSPDGLRILTASRDGTAKVWYTPEAIFNWLQYAPIQRLSEADKKIIRN